jgi:monomeric isocitrate dehydrogenase
MKLTEQTQQQLERTLRKLAEKFPAEREASILTDIHIRVSQDTGEVTILDDDDQELTRCVVEEWIDNKDDDFYEEITTIIHRCLASQEQLVDNLSILKPYAFVLEDDERTSIAELYVVDGDTVIVDPDLMEGLDKDLDDFLEKLLKS